MRILLRLLLLASVCTSGFCIAEVTVSNNEHGVLDNSYCRKPKVESDLRTRFEESDVVLSGTLLGLLPSKHGRRSQSNETETSAISGHLKVWEVLKGSLEHVPNVTETRVVRAKQRKRKRDLETVHRHNSEHNDGNVVGRSKWDNFVMQQATDDGRASNRPMVTVYGLQNSHMCSSFVKEGDTRLFFLRKMENFRRSKRSKRKSKKRCGGKRKRDSGKRKRKCKRRDLLAKYKRSSSASNKTRRNGKPKRRRRASSKPKYLLLVHEQPARISMRNLNTLKAITA
ncbi:uncharacterized protein LOC113474588 [Ciona intestinalis]